jgi:hypothetical protein
VTQQIDAIPSIFKGTKLTAAYPNLEYQENIKSLMMSAAIARTAADMNSNMDMINHIVNTYDYTYTSSNIVDAVMCNDERLVDHFISKVRDVKWDHVMSACLTVNNEKMYFKLKDLAHEDDFSFSDQQVLKWLATLYPESVIDDNMLRILNFQAQDFKVGDLWYITPVINNLQMTREIALLVKANHGTPYVITIGRNTTLEVYKYLDQFFARDEESDHTVLEDLIYADRDDLVSYILQTRVELTPEIATSILPSNLSLYPIVADMVKDALSARRS